MEFKKKKKDVYPHKKKNRCMVLFFQKEYDKKIINKKMIYKMFLRMGGVPLVSFDIIQAY